MKTLASIKILDFSRLLPGPFCSYLLAEQGAAVTSVIAPHLEEVLSFPAIQKNKKFIRLDLKDKKDFQKALKLISKSDVILEGFRPGAMERLGLSFKYVRKINPKIIYCSLSGYGQEEKERAGHDLNFLAETGFLKRLAAGAIPKVPGLPLGDLIAGQNAAFQISAVLVKPKRKATYLDLSIQKSAGQFLVPFNGIEKQVQPLFAGHYARYQIYQTQDDKYFVLAALEEKFWRKLVEHLKIKPSLLKSSEENILKYLRKLFKQKPLSFWKKDLAHPDFCMSVVL